VPKAKPLDLDELLDLEQAAELLRVNPRTIRRYIESGRLPGYRAGPRVLRVKRSDLAALFELAPR
jgi:excisionase family DNA binding protein